MPDLSESFNFLLLLLHIPDRTWMLVGPADAIPQREELAVVAIEEEMVVGVVSRPIDVGSQTLGDPVVPVMYKDGPQVHEEKHGHEKKLV